MWDGSTHEPVSVSRIAAEDPHWEPDTAAGYHAILWGFLAGELAQRTTGKSLGQLLRERIAGPLDADFHIGLPDSEHHRVADLIRPNHARVQRDPAPLLGTFGHNGAGGSIGFADPARRLGVGYAMNQMQPGVEVDTRGSRLVRAVLECV